MQPDQLPYEVRQRADGRWSVYDATGREVEGVAKATPEECEHVVRVILAMRQAQGMPYVHIMPREGGAA